jgi:hypothetical protein
MIRNANDIDARSFLAANLEDYALELAEDQLADVLNCPIPEIGPLESVDFSVLREVVAHVMASRRPQHSTTALRVPDFREKIQFNGLTSQVADLLRYAAYQIDAVDDYFSKNSSFAKQDLRDRLNEIYIQSRTTVAVQGASAEYLSDLVFFRVADKMTPAHADSRLYMAAAIQEAVFIVMAYYFEACDIFEDPDATT